MLKTVFARETTTICPYCAVGSAALDNEECWILQAMMRALGLVYIEHQVRI